MALGYHLRVAGVTAHVLLTGIQTGPVALVADAFEVGAVAVYLVGVRRLARRGREWSPWVSAAFVTGIFAVWLAVGSGLARYDETNVTVHVVQHVLLMMIAAPLIALGKPVTLATQAVGRANQTRLVRLTRHPAVTALTFPVVGGLLYYGLMYAMFTSTGVYDYTVGHPVFHDASHLVLLAVGFIYWQPLVGGEQTRWRMAPPVRVLAVFLGMPLEAFLGISMRMRSQPLGPRGPIGDTLANTQSAGQTFLILAMLAGGLCIAIIAARWLGDSERRTGREDRRASAAAAGSRALAEQLGVQGVPEGWAVPPWRLAELQARQVDRG